MGKMYTLQPNESINDHVKDTRDIINHIVELSIGCMRDLANPHEGTFVDMTFNKFMRSLEHIRESIQMLDELCDELEEDKDEIRREYEEKVIQFFNRFMNADLTDEANDRLGECVRHIHEIDNHYMREIQELTKKSNQLEEQEQHWHDIAVARVKENDDLADQLADVKNERDKLKHQLEIANKITKYSDEKIEKIETQYELAKKFLHQRRAEISRLKEELREAQIVKDAQKRVIDEKENALLRLNHEIWELQEQAEYWEDIAKKYADPDGHKVNNPANFCGNCKYFKIHPNDVGMCENICGHYSKIVDPDDASCQAFESNKPNVVIGKPEHPCCEHCEHEDCDDCSLCPF